MDGILAFYFGFYDINKRLEKIDFEKEFSNYSDILKKRLNEGGQMNNLLDGAYKSLQTVLNDHRLPYIFLTNVLSFLRDDDLRALNLVC